MSDSSSSRGGGMGICGVLTTVFVVLKLVGVISWSWWWVLSPIWISIGIVVIGLGLLVLINVLD